MIKKQNKCENRKQEEEIRNFVCKMHEYQMAEIPGNRDLSQKYQMSELFYQKMEKLIRQQNKKAKKKEIRRGIMAAAAVIVLLVMVSHPQYIAEAGEKIIQWFSDHVSFQFKEDTDVNWIPRYEMEYVPEGYELVTDEYYEGAGVIEYYNE